MNISPNSWNLEKKMFKRTSYVVFHSFTALQCNGHLWITEVLSSSPVFICSNPLCCQSSVTTHGCMISPLASQGSLYIYLQCTDTDSHQSQEEKKVLAQGQTVDKSHWMPPSVSVCSPSATTVRQRKNEWVTLVDRETAAGEFSRIV